MEGALTRGVRRVMRWFMFQSGAAFDGFGGFGNRVGSSRDK